jgi:hypothetical protein
MLAGLNVDQRRPAGTVLEYTSAKIELVIDGDDHA